MSKSKIKKESTKKFERGAPIDFAYVKKQAESFAQEIEKNREALTDILLEYESFEVVEDEIARTLDLLTSLDENEEYFSHYIGSVTAFMPRNQPLYALSCFVLVPSLMATEAHFRIPAAMTFFMPRVLELLKVKEYFPNIYISDKERLAFLKERSAMRVNPEDKEQAHPVTDVVIFTGTSAHADQLRVVFDNQTLFITNGSGHNPIVVTPTADLDDAVNATLTLTLYNQGQDCAAPNAIIVHKEVHDAFLKILLEKLKKVKIGAYKNRDCRVGPISSAKDLVRIKEFLVQNRLYMHPETPGRINTLDVILEPVVITKPICDGGNYDEIYAPIIMVQEYESDEDLKKYFEQQRYAQHAMYVTVYGENDYIETLKDKKIGGRKVHDKYSVIKNTHLHAPGIERGTEPYGGRGVGASSVGYRGKLYGKATLPQRDIFEWLVKPLIESEQLEDAKKRWSTLTEKVEKDVSKLLRMRNGKQKEEPAKQKHNGTHYLDKHVIDENNGRFVKIGTTLLYTLLQSPNVEYISHFGIKEIDQMRALRNLLGKKEHMTEEEFKKELYAIPKKLDVSDVENQKRQKEFFIHLYNIFFAQPQGPRLNHFLYEVDNSEVLPLLDM